MEKWSNKRIKAHEGYVKHKEEKNAYYISHLLMIHKME